MGKGPLPDLLVSVCVSQAGQFCLMRLYVASLILVRVAFVYPADRRLCGPSVHLDLSLPSSVIIPDTAAAAAPGHSGISLIYILTSSVTSRQNPADDDTAHNLSRNWCSKKVCPKLRGDAIGAFPASIIIIIIIIAGEPLAGA